MIAPQSDYAMLMASLPTHALSLWNVKHSPLSRVQLERRLSLLNEQDSQLLVAIEKVLHWSKIPEVDNDSLIEGASKQLLDSLDNQFLQQVIIWRLDIRTIMTALRRRKLGVLVTDPDMYWGYGSLVSSIKRNWQLEDFSLAYRYPWVKEANFLLNKSECVALEKLLLNLSWQHYEKIGHGHYFDFEAVILYVLRWDIINRWSQNDEQSAMQHFEVLVEAGLGDTFPQC